MQFEPRLEPVEFNDFNPGDFGLAHVAIEDGFDWKYIIGVRFGNFTSAVVIQPDVDGFPVNVMNTQRIDYVWKIPDARIQLHELDRPNEGNKKRLSSLMLGFGTTFLTMNVSGFPLQLQPQYIDCRTWERYELTNISGCYAIHRWSVVVPTPGTYQTLVEVQT